MTFWLVVFALAGFWFGVALEKERVRLRTADVSGSARGVHACAWLLVISVTIIAVLAVLILVTVEAFALAWRFL